MTTVAAPTAVSGSTAIHAESDTVDIGELVDGVRRLAVHGAALCPAGVDAREWSQETLRDLARVAELLDGAAARLSGRHNDALARHAHSLAVVIDAHRSLASTRSPLR